MARLLVPLSAALMVLAAPVAAPAVDLKPKLRAGTETHYLMTSRYDVTQKVETAPDQPPREVKMTLASDVGMRLTCSEVKDDGSAVLKWTLLYLAITSEGGMPMRHDSRDPSQTDSPVGYMFAPLLNHPATVTLDATGAVSDYQDPGALGGGPVRQFTDMLFSKEAFENLDIFPGKGSPADAGVGATWSDTETVDMSQGLGTMLVSSNYKLEGLKEGGKLADISVEGSMSMKKPEATEGGSPAPQAGMVIDKGVLSGRRLWDCAAGQAISSESTSQLVGTATGGFGKVALEQGGTLKVTRATPEEFERAAKPPTTTAPAASQPATEKRTDTGRSTPEKPGGH
ncbi:MAG: hypothetical protein V2A79_15230 [Planctomycetota bacterium]